MPHVLAVCVRVLAPVSEHGMCCGAAAALALPRVAASTWTWRQRAPGESGEIRTLYLPRTQVATDVSSSPARRHDGVSRSTAIADVWRCPDVDVAGEYLESGR